MLEWSRFRAVYPTRLEVIGAYIGPEVFIGSEGAVPSYQDARTPGAVYAAMQRNQVPVCQYRIISTYFLNIWLLFGNTYA